MADRACCSLPPAISREAWAAEMLPHSLMLLQDDAIVGYAFVMALKETGYVRHVYGARPEPWNRIALAGDYLVAPTVEGAAVSGTRAAERLLALD